MSKSSRHDDEYMSFKIKKAVPVHKLRDDIRDREARTECSDAKKFKEAGSCS